MGKLFLTKRFEICFLLALEFNMMLLMW